MNIFEGNYDPTKSCNVAMSNAGVDNGVVGKAGMGISLMTNQICSADNHVLYIAW